MRLTAAFLLILSLNRNAAMASTDTVTVMAYNVLYYGETPNCQGSNSTYHNYLKTIVSYASPDILSLEKMGAIKLSPADTVGNAPYGFADSVLSFALNAAYADRYSYCSFTNGAGADNVSVLFYDKNKFGFAGIVFSYANITDFNLYKLYYRDSGLAAGTDTTFLYILPNHTNSGSSSNNQAVRNQQISGYMQQIANKFDHLPNLITMGDFNAHASTEAFYQTLVNPADTNYKFYDPPFSIDNQLSYPADWDDNPADYASYLTTSTRASASVPNSCGTSGGAKSWYDHIFISSWIAHNANRIQYVPGSYNTLGNDGQRLGVSINDNSNTAAPDSVIEAEFQMSNKYPVMAKLAISHNIPTATAVNQLRSNITIVNPVVNNKLTINIPNPGGQNIFIECYNAMGQQVIKKAFTANDQRVILPFDNIPGNYFLKITNDKQVLYNGIITKQ